MPKIEKITKAIVHGFSILDVLGESRNQTVFYRKYRLYVHVMYTKLCIRILSNRVENSENVQAVFYGNFGQIGLNKTVFFYRSKGARALIFVA